MGKTHYFFVNFNCLRGAKATTSRVSGNGIYSITQECDDKTFFLGLEDLIEKEITKKEREEFPIERGWIIESIRIENISKLN